MATSRDKAFSVEKYLESVKPRESVDFYGLTVTAPNDVPMAVTLRQKEFESISLDDAEGLFEFLGALLGVEVSNQVRELCENPESSPGVQSLAVLLMWAQLNAEGTVIDFPTAYQRYLETAEEAEGKAVPNRADRRASGTKSGGTSRTSSRTSKGSTK